MKLKHIATRDPRDLTTKQRLFVAEYLIDLNATRAAIAAGYSTRTAQEQGSRLLSNVMVSAEIAEKQSRRFQCLGITADAVLKELAKIAFSNMLDYIQVTAAGDACIDLSNLTRDQAAAIVEITVEEFTERAAGGKSSLQKIRRTKFKLSDKRAALVDLGRHLKLFTDKFEVEQTLQLDMQDARQKLLAKIAAIQIEA